jgi:hypothetical protein
VTDCCALVLVAREIREISTQALRAFKDENIGAIEVVKSSMQGGC